MTSQLIPVFNGTISNETALLVNARDLHTFLDVGKRFASWIVERIAEYGFVENQDFMIISQVREKIGRGRPAKDYHLTLDTAKELAMVERNEKGRQVRRYFIECEKRLRQQETKVEKVLSGFMPAIMEAIKLEDKKRIQRPTEARLPQPDSLAVWCSRPDGELTADESVEPVTGRRARRIGQNYSPAIHFSNFDGENGIRSVCSPLIQESIISAHCCNM
ncbi:hypothetical protein JMT78AECX_JMT78AEC_00607 [Escherichia coli]|nr:hypothetical protein JMT78AECX_JMT78AEC_00607 [Escherichia coli]